MDVGATTGLPLLPSEAPNLPCGAGPMTADKSLPPFKAALLAFLGGSAGPAGPGGHPAQDWNA
jgi:hypothetical protein